jgi:uncharacterized Zn finger protein
MSGWGKEEADSARDAVQREIARRIQRGASYVPMEVVRSTKLARQFWGLAWQRHLETFEHFGGRLTAGRSYLRKGQLYNFTIEPGRVTAEVAGGALYEVQVRVRPMEEASWTALVEKCQGRVSNALDLLAGKLSDEVMRDITATEGGLFPAPSEVAVICNCPDYADVCKHGAAVLYAIGLELDQRPASFFHLRGVDHLDLLRDAGSGLQVAAETSEALDLPESELENLFGIKLQE